MLLAMSSMMTMPLSSMLFGMGTDWLFMLTYLASRSF